MLCRGLQRLDVTDKARDVVRRRAAAQDDEANEVHVDPHGALHHEQSGLLETHVQQMEERDAPEPEAGESEKKIEKEEASGNSTSSSGSLGSSEDDDEFNGHPTVTGFKEEGCDGDKLGIFVMDGFHEDMTGENCLQIRKPDGKKGGRIKFSCGEGGVGAKVCVYHELNDTKCEMTQPYCMDIHMNDAPKVASGACIMVDESPIEKTTYVRFQNFPADSKWPSCLQPPMGTTAQGIYIVGGVVCGMLINMIAWCAYFKGDDEPSGKSTQSEHDMGYGPPMMGKGKGKDQGGGSGEHFGEQWGGKGGGEWGGKGW